MKKAASVILVEILNGRNNRECCDGAQQGCYSTQMLPWPVYVAHKEEKIPMENCTAGTCTAHYSDAPCRNDTITSIWAVPDPLWASSLDSLRGLYQ